MGLHEIKSDKEPDSVVATVSPEETIKPPDQPEAPSFIYFAKKGAPKGMTLEPSLEVVDPTTGKVRIVPGIGYMALKYHPDPSVRIIDCTQQDCCLRAQNRIPPAILAQRIEATEYFQRGLIVTKEEYDFDMSNAAEKGRAIAALEAQFENERKMKFRKRGQS